MNIEEKATKLIKEFSEELKKASDSVLDQYYTDVLPHVEYDTEMNVEYRANDIVQNLLAGNFKQDEGYFIIQDSSGIDTKVKITNEEYNRVRKQLIAIMPKCPKDLEIESLNNRIKQIYNDRY